MKPMEVAVYEKPVIVKIDTGTSPLIITDQGSGIVTIIDPTVIKAVTLSQDVTVKVNDGIHGKDGVDGINGLPGKDGSRGMPGNSGIQGPRGIQGITGNRGPYGLQGPRGDIGLRGIQGPQGILGLRGAQGPYGVRGAQGPAGIVDLPTILPVITGNIDIHDFIPNHALTLDQLFTFWRAIGETLLTDYPNGLSLVEVIQSTTANSIIDAVVDLRASVDGQFILAYSYIDQTAYAIDQRVTNTQRTLNDKITIAESRIFQTESSILSTVSRLTDIDGPGGFVSLLQSSIDQQADSLTLEVLARQGVDNDLQESKSRITMLDDTLSLLVETFDAVNSRLTTTEIVLDEKGIALSALESHLAYSISTQQRLLKNSWGVVIEEDTNGNTYTAGFDLIVNAIWIEDYDYIVGDAIYFNNAVYECIQNHVASVSNNPAGEFATTYWSILPNGKKSEINFKVDGFNILTTAGAVPLFSADSSGRKIIINGDLDLTKDDGLIQIEGNGSIWVNTGTVGKGLIIGDYANGAGWIMNGDGLLNYNNRSQIHCFWDKDANLEWQQSSFDMVNYAPIDPNFTIPGGSVVLGLYNYKDAAGNPHGGLCWHQGEKKLFIRGATVTDSVLDWSNIGPSIDRPQDRATVGAEWGDNIANQPTTLADINADELADLQTAKNNAILATAAIAVFSLDSALSPIEKRLTKKEMDIIVAEESGIVTQATTYGVSSTAYSAAFTALYNYMAPLLVDLTVSSEITGDTLRLMFKTYFDARTEILKSIADKAATKAIWSLVTGTGKPSDNADVTQTALDLGASIDNAKANGSTLIDGGYIRTNLIDTDNMIVNKALYIGSYNAASIASISTKATSANTHATSTHAPSDADRTIDSDFVKVTYPADKATLQNQIDGKIESWFQSNDPATAWTTTAIKQLHNGDWWWNTSTQKLKRYTGTGWSAELTDKTATDAFDKASTAQSTADGKMVVFTTTPSNYDVGDLWDVGGNPRTLKRATRARTTYVAGDWIAIANEVTNTNQVTDGAGLGSKAVWQYVTGDGKPADNADKTSSVLPSNSLAWKTAVSAAMLDTTVISGGYIKTSLIKTSAIVIGDLSGASTFTAYNTNRVNGTAASTVVSNAAAGATFTSTTWANALIGKAKLDTTIIDGGYIKTDLISLDTLFANQVITGNLSFSGVTSTIQMSGLYSQIKMSGLYSQIVFPGTSQYISGGYTDLSITGGDGRINIKTNYITLFSDQKRLELYLGHLRPTSDHQCSLGYSSRNYWDLYATNIYDGGILQDSQDDLVVLNGIKARTLTIENKDTKEISTVPDIHEKSGMEYIDLLSLPQWMTNYDSLKREFFAENGDLVTDADFDEWIADQNEMGYRLKRNLNHYTDLISGGVRQLDSEMIGMFDLIASRVTALEKQIVELTKTEITEKI